MSEFERKPDIGPSDCIETNDEEMMSLLSALGNRQENQTKAERDALQEQVRALVDLVPDAMPAHNKGANWMRQQCLELGAQQQKVVELPNVYTWSNSEVVYLAELKQALDAAGVKWEVKK